MTSGAVTSNGSISYVYPPTGFSISNLWAFIPSIRTIYFNGDVDDSDTLYCFYAVETANNRIRIECQNTENRGNSGVNYLGIWKK